MNNVGQTRHQILGEGRVSGNEDRIRIIEKRLDESQCNTDPDSITAEKNERVHRSNNVMLFNLLDSNILFIVI